MSDLNIGNAQPPKRTRPNVIRRPATGDEEDIRKPIDLREPESYGDVDPAPRPVNPYAPTGWKTKHRVEFDLRLPDKFDEHGNVTVPGQLCRIMRLERDDLFRLNLAEYLNTFTPLLLGDNKSDEERTEAMTKAMEENPEALQNMLTAIDKVVQAATVKPRITEDPELVDYGTEQDWEDMNFIPVVPLDNIPMVDRMFIFGAAFGRSMDDLKSIWDQTEGLGSLANESSLQQASQ